MLDLSNASGILGLLRTFMLTIKTREFGVLIAGCMRVKHPNVEKASLPSLHQNPLALTSKRAASSVFAAVFSCSPVSGCSWGSVDTFGHHFGQKRRHKVPHLIVAKCGISATAADKLVVS